MATLTTLATRNPLEKRLGYHLRRASAVVLADLANSLSDLGLSVVEASVLLLIDANPDMTQSEVGRILGIKRANMAPMAGLFDERGLIERAPVDGRSQALRTSPAGRAVAAEIERRMETHEARILPELSPEERTMLLTLLRKMWAGAAA